MDNLLGILRVHVKRGINLAVRDISSSDPYVVLKLGRRQKLKTKFVKQNVNPTWDENLTFTVTDPNLPLNLVVYDHDMFSKDDKMGNAEIDLKPYIEALRMELYGLPEGTIISKINPKTATSVGSTIEIFKTFVSDSVTLSVEKSRSSFSGLISPVQKPIFENITLLLYSLIGLTPIT